jgi:anti-sigma regulatory factor (Ser/Thr protein kinase)
MNKFCLNTPVELKVAADPGMMLVIRLTTAGVVTRAGLTIDAMDNLKIATEEACNCLIGDEGDAPSRLCLRFAQEENELVIRISGDNIEAGRCISEDESCVICCILESLVDKVSVEKDGEMVHAVVLRIALDM